MELSDMQARVTELEQQISALPAGSVTKKTVSGKDYFYHRWTENKKRREKYIPADELESFRAQIERRKELEQELKALHGHHPDGGISQYDDYRGSFGSSIRHSAGIRHVVPQPANVHLPVTGSHQGQIFCYRICLD